MLPTLLYMCPRKLNNNNKNNNNLLCLAGLPLNEQHINMFVLTFTNVITT